MDSPMIGETSAVNTQWFRWMGMLLILMVICASGSAMSGAWAQEAQGGAKILIETNLTSGNAGIQVSLDGEEWKTMSVKGPDGKKVVGLKAKGDLKKTVGLTELFWESEESTFSEMTLAALLEMFPEGDYEFKGKSLAGDKFTTTATLAHELPCGPENLSPAEETVSPSGVDIAWDPVVAALNDIGGACSPDPIRIETYEVIVEDVATGNQLDISLHAGVNMVEVPDEFIENGKTYTYKVLAIADNGNQTIVETFFCTGTPGAACSRPPN
ncbi:MAG: hypothetical protein PVH30_11155 [Desulfobacterales bacterium]